MAEYDDSEDAGVFETAKNEARDSLKGKPLRELAEIMVGYRQNKDDLEAELKIVNAYFDVLRFELVPERMELDGVDRIVYDGIGRLQTTGDALVAVKPGQKEAFYAWLKKNKLEDLIQPVVNASTLKAFVKGRIKGGLSYPTDCLNVTPITRASITKVATTKK